MEEGILRRVVGCNLEASFYVAQQESPPAGQSQVSSACDIELDRWVAPPEMTSGMRGGECDRDVAAEIEAA